MLFAPVNKRAYGSKDTLTQHSSVTRTARLLNSI